VEDAPNWRREAVEFLCHFGLLAVKIVKVRCSMLVLVSVLARGNANQSTENQPEIALIAKSYVLPDFGY
jgi:hypothetical protein